MKKLNLVCTVIVMLLLSGCRKESDLIVRELNPDLDAKIIAGIVQSPEKGIPFPEGTKAMLTESGMVQLILPKGYHYIVTKAGSDDPQILNTEEALGVTCNCTKGNNCTPVKYKGKYYCVMGDGCSSCDKSATIDEIEVDVKGLYNENADITLLVKKQAQGLAAMGTSTLAETIGGANAALFKQPFVKEGLFKLYNFIYEDNIPSFIVNNEKNVPAGYRMVAVNIYGNIAGIPIPSNMMKDNFLELDAKTVCQCNDTSPVGCEKDSFFGAVYCEAKGCKSCSLLD